MRRAFLALVLLSTVSCLASCAEIVGGDPAVDGGTPAVGGKGKTIKLVSDPGVDGHADNLTQPQTVSGAVVIAVDTFDETANGKGTGTIYVQDIGSTDAYSGISLFSPTFNPGNLAVGPGDVLDMTGTYQENTMIGSTVTFAMGSVLPQISRPTATFRYEGSVPTARVIDVGDLADFKKARQWLGMLVTVKNITLGGDAVNDMNGRVAVNINTGATGGKCDSAFPKSASLVNDLFDLGSLGYKSGDKLASITGVVGFFCNVHLAPRSKADLKK